MSKKTPKKSNTVTAQFTTRLNPSKSGRSIEARSKDVLPQKVARSSKTGRFMDGVRKVSARDRVGLIKLADR